MHWLQLLDVSANLPPSLYALFYPQLDYVPSLSSLGSGPNVTLGTSSPTSLPFSACLNHIGKIMFWRDADFFVTSSIASNNNTYMEIFEESLKEIRCTISQDLCDHRLAIVITIVHACDTCIYGIHIFWLNKLVCHATFLKESLSSSCLNKNFR